MTNHKQEALDEIVRIIRSSNLTLAEVGAHLRSTAVEEKQKSSTLAANIFGYIGGLFVFGGISVLINMKWDSFGPLGHIALTLIPGLIAFLFGVYCTFDPKIEKAATPLFLLAAAVEPTGIMIALREYGVDSNPAHGVLFMCLVMLVQQGLVFAARQRTVLAFISAVFALVFLATAFDMEAVRAQYIGLIVGAAELCIAYALDKSRHRAIAPVNYFFGSVFFLSGLADCTSQTPYELVFLGATCAFIYASILARSRSLLGVSAVAMLIFIGDYSAKHFAHAVGWPLTLILGGVCMIGLGAVVVKINNTYIKQS